MFTIEKAATSRISVIGGIDGIYDTRYRENVPVEDRIPVAAINPCLATGPWIAGGAAVQWFLGNHVSDPNRLGSRDIDVFFANKEQLEVVKQTLESVSASCKFISDNALTYEVLGTKGCWTIQLITNRFFDSATDVINNFDIRAVQIATDGVDFVHCPGTLRDIKDKKLHFVKYAPGAAKRLVKYMSYGYTPEEDQVVHILTTSELIPTELNVVESYEAAF